MSNESGWSTRLDFTAFRGHVAKFFRLGTGLLQFNIDMAYYLHPDAHYGLTPPIGAQVVSADDDALLYETIDRINPTHAFIWNGTQYAATASRLRDRGIVVVFCELGWFPQAPTFYFDTSGVGGFSSIRHHPVSSFSIHPDFYHFRNEYVGKRRNMVCKHLNFVLLPLQLELDSNILFFSKFKTMESFIAYVSESLPDATLIARPHPLDKEREWPAFHNVHIDSSSPLDSLIASCSAVVGINSTVLYEALMFEKPVFALGDTIAPPGSVFFGESDLATLNAIVDSQVGNNDVRDGFLSELLYRRQIQLNDLLNRDTLLTNHFWGRLLSSSQCDEDSPLRRLGEEYARLDASHRKVWATYRHLEQQLKAADTAGAWSLP
jgi:hypothetical protein